MRKPYSKPFLSAKIMNKMNHAIFMNKALKLACKGIGRTSPNPMVGAVIVKNGKVIASGYHKKAGTPHAEAIALNEAGKKANGATMYVTLEPCCHTDKRTAPCTKAIINSGIKKVFIAMTDPNPKVSGLGIRELQKAGIEAVSGLLEDKAKMINEGYIKYITRKVPFVILKVAQTLDGKIATAKGESKWITGAEAREHVHKLRNEVDAVLVGIDTVIKDDPSLDCRIKNGRNPFRIIIDSSLRISHKAKLLQHKDYKTIIATTSKADRKKIARLTSLEAKVLIIKSIDGRVDLRELMKELGRLEITSLMIEGGSSINASALKSRIVDKVMLFLAPKIMGGTDSVSSIGGKSPALLKNIVSLKNVQIKRFGRDVLIEGYPFY